MLRCAASFGAGGVVSLAAVAVAVDSAEIRDLHGVVSPGGLPPFAASAIIFLLALFIFLASRCIRKKRSAEPGHGAASSFDALSDVEDGYRQGHLPASLLFQRVEAIVRATLADVDSSASTNEEILARARLTMPPGIIGRAAAVLVMCERVRFGAFVPGTEPALGAVEEARVIIREIGEAGR